MNAMHTIWNQLVTFYRVAAEKPWLRDIFQAVRKSFIEAVIDVLTRSLQGRRGGGLSAA